MKRIIGFSIIALIIAISVIFTVQARKNLRQAGKTKQTVVEESKRRKIVPDSKPDVPKTERAKIDFAKTEEDQRSSESEQLEMIQMIAQEFDVPQGIQNELLQAIKSGNIETDWGKEGVTEKEMQEAALTSSQVADAILDSESKNIIAGHTTDAETFDEILAATHPTEDSEDEQTITLKSEALITLAFSAMSEQKYDQAEKAFKDLFEYFPDSEVIPIARLEYARLLLETGRIDEAKEAVAEAIFLNNDNQEYIETAETLIEAIENNEQNNQK